MSERLRRPVGRVVRVRRAAAAALAGTGLLLPTASHAAAGSAEVPGTSSGLHMIAVGPSAWLAHRALPIRVVVHNPQQQLFCSDFVLSITWTQPHRSAGTVSVVTANDLGTSTAQLAIPAPAVRPGVLRYWVSAQQQCGFPEQTASYGARVPSQGWRTVLITGAA